MRFEVLGDVRVCTASSRLPLRGRKGRLLLAMLVSRANHPVSTDSLVEALWGPRPSDSAATTLRWHVHQLRKLLRQPDRLVSTGTGYLLRAVEEELDSSRFEALRATAIAARDSADPMASARWFREALELWRGPAYGDLADSPSLREESARLEQLRLDVTEQCVAVELDLGRHDALVGELTELVSRFPLRERMRAQLMLALYRCGRHAEALQTYQDGRQRLAGELGIDPGPELCDLHTAILTADPALGVRMDRSVGAGYGRRTPSPAQLPADVIAFTGRGDQLRELTKLVEAGGQAMVISAIAGTAGVGKTALAVHWAHQVRDRFPDGQLYVNLRGYDTHRPVTAADALGRFLTALGVSGADVPVEVEELAARYRSEVAGRRMLIVLDNASTVEQVRPLLPGSESCAVVVTSRDSLAGLVAVHGASRLDLDLLPAGDAITLLRRLLGERVDAQPEAAASLADQCARLPLALRVAAELAVSRPATPLSDLVTELVDQQQRLGMLGGSGDPRADVAGVISWSLRHLPPKVATAFGLLGLQPGGDFDAYTAAALCNSDLLQARRILDKLARAHLVHATGAGRYGMHDLLRAYANSLTTAEASATDRRAALTRLFDYYLATTGAAMDTLYPAETHRRPQIPPPTTPAPDLTDPDPALAWLDAERPCLVAAAAYTAAHGWPTHTTRLSTTLFRYLGGGHYTDALAVHRHARDAARQAGDQAGEAEALVGSGAFHGRMGQFGEAAHHLRRALVLLRGSCDRTGEARALGNLGIVEERLGHYRSAADHLRHALPLYRQVGDRTGEASVLDSLGIVEERLGHYRSAVDHHEQALAVCRQIGDQAGEARGLTDLGVAESRLGHHRLAADHHEQAVRLFRKLGDRAGEAWALDNLGRVRTRLDHADQATRHHQQALTFFREAGDRDGQAWALNGLAEAALATGHPADALAHHTAALATSTHTGAREPQARAHAGLGTTHRTVGDTALARYHYEHALTLYKGLGSPDADNVRVKLSALPQPPKPDHHEQGQ